MDDLDTLLARMKDRPADARLDRIDAQVFAGLDRRRHAAVSARAIGLVAMLSAGVGIAGATLPAQPTRTAALFPLAATETPLPSALLGSAG